VRNLFVRLGLVAGLLLLVIVLAGLVTPRVSKNTLSHTASSGFHFTLRTFSSEDPPRYTHLPKTLVSFNNVKEFLHFFKFSTVV
jgi:hypothetical protein